MAPCPWLRTPPPSGPPAGAIAPHASRGKTRPSNGKSPPGARAARSGAARFRPRLHTSRSGAARSCPRPHPTRPRAEPPRTGTEPPRPRTERPRTGAEPSQTGMEPPWTGGTDSRPRGEYSRTGKDRARTGIQDSRTGIEDSRPRGTPAYRENRPPCSTNGRPRAALLVPRLPPGDGRGWEAPASKEQVLRTETGGEAEPPGQGASPGGSLGTRGKRKCRPFPLQRSSRSRFSTPEMKPASC